MVPSRDMEDVIFFSVEERRMLSFVLMEVGFSSLSEKRRRETFLMFDVPIVKSGRETREELCESDVVFSIAFALAFCKEENKEYKETFPFSVVELILNPN